MKILNMKIQMTEKFAEKLFELAHVNVPEGYEIGGFSKEHQIAGAMSNALCDLMAERKVIEVNEFGGFEKPTLREMTIEGHCINLKEASWQ